MFRLFFYSVGLFGALCAVPLSASGQGCDAKAKDSGYWAGGCQSCCECDPCDGVLQRLLNNTNCGCWLSERGVNVRGWLDQGVTANAHGPRNNSNLPVTFNDRDEYQLNQLYLIAERPVARCGCDWDFGGRVDLLYGTDYYFTSAVGGELRSDGSQRWNGQGPRGFGAGSAALYGVALPQFYGEVYSPIFGGTNIKFGHFYSPMGVESVMAPENFFYSHSYARQYAEPFTLTGAVAEYQLTDRLRAVTGATLGWNSWESNRNQWGILAGLVWDSCDECTSLASYVHTGEDGPPGINLPAFFNGPIDPNNVTACSLVLSHSFTDRLQYIFQHDIGAQQNGAVSGGRQHYAYWYGINQYLLYTLSECWALGLRGEWFRDEDHARILGLAGAGGLVNGGNYYALSAGMNWTPSDNIIVRPEVRWDWSDAESPVLAVGGPYDFLSKDNQLTFAVDAILRF